MTAGIGSGNKSDWRSNEESAAVSLGGTSSGGMFSPFIVNQGGGLWWAVAVVILGVFLWKRRG